MKKPIPFNHYFHTERDEEIISILCNKCEREAHPSHPGDYWSQNLMHEIQTHFGYGSAHDMESWNFHLCETCLLEFIKTFKIMPKGFYDDYRVSNSSKENEEMFKKWKDEPLKDPFKN